MSKTVIPPFSLNQSFTVINLVRMSHEILIKLMYYLVILNRNVLSCMGFNEDLYLEMLQVLALSVLAVVLRHPELMSYDHSSAGPEPTPLAELELIHDEGGNLQLTLGQIPERPISIQNNNFASRASYYREFEVS